MKGKSISNKIKFGIYFFVFLIYSCDSNQRVDSSVHRVSKILIGNPVTSGTLDWTEIADSITIIPLATSQNSLVSSIYKIRLFGDFLYLYDLRQKTIFIFKSSGDFIGRIEGGPDSVSPREVRDFEIKDSTLYVLSYKELVRYSLNGKQFLSRQSFRMEDMSDDYFNPTQFAINNDGFWFWGGTVGITNFKDPIFPLSHVTFDFKRQGNFIPVKGPLISRYMFSTFEGKVLINPLYGYDSIFLAQNNNVLAAYHFDFGDKSVTRNDLINGKGNEGQLFYNVSNNTDRCSGVRNVAITSRYIYFQYMCGKTNYHAIFEKETKEIRTGIFVSNKNTLPISIIGTYGDKLIGYAEVPYLKDTFSQLGNNIPSVLLPLKASMQNIREDNNPIIIILSLK